AGYPKWFSPVIMEGARNRFAMPIAMSANAANPVLAQYRAFLFLVVVPVLFVVAKMSSPLLLRTPQEKAKRMPNPIACKSMEL
ncbi:MAG TPA: hypothetical protein VMT53_13010, partial [Terriglobales bacterium]|nr:hypothetical protein [Terriglobales bacterium]